MSNLEWLFAKTISFLSCSLKSRDLSAFTRLHKDQPLPVVLANWQGPFFLFSNVKTEKLQRGLVNSKIINSISFPKLPEFCNENAATWRPSSLQSHYSYIIKRLVKRLNQPMTATLIKTARGLKVYHETGRLLQGNNFRLGSHAAMFLLV